MKLLRNFSEWSLMEQKVEARSQPSAGTGLFVGNQPYEKNLTLRAKRDIGWPILQGI